MATMGVYMRDEISAQILSGIMLTVRFAQVQGYDEMFVAGVLAMAEHEALSHEINWTALLETAKCSLSAKPKELIEGAQRLIDG